MGFSRSACVCIWIADGVYWKRDFVAIVLCGAFVWVVDDSEVEGERVLLVLRELMVSYDRIGKNVSDKYEYFNF